MPSIPAAIRAWHEPTDARLGVPQKRHQVGMASGFRFPRAPSCFTSYPRVGSATAAAKQARPPPSATRLSRGLRARNALLLLSARRASLCSLPAHGRSPRGSLRQRVECGTKVVELSGALYGELSAMTKKGMPWTPSGTLLPYRFEPRRVIRLSSTAVAPFGRAATLGERSQDRKRLSLALANMRGRRRVELLNQPRSRHTPPPPARAVVVRISGRQRAAKLRGAFADVANNASISAAGKAPREARLKWPV
jgi:hypothetical protein